VRNAEPSRHVVARARGHDAERHLRAGHEIRAEVDHAVAANHDKGIGSGCHGSRPRGHELLEVRLLQARDVVAQRAERLHHRRTHVAALAERRGRVDRHHQAQRLRRSSHPHSMARERPGRAFVKPLISVDATCLPSKERKGRTMTTPSPNAEPALHAAKRPRSVLAGPYGHPLHPLLVTIPIGAWTASLIFDIAGGVTGEWGVFATAAQWLIGIGIVGAVLAAVLGLLDYSKLTPQTRAHRIATLHLAINLAVVVLFVIGWLLRAAVPGEPSAAGIVLSVIALLALSVSGFLGGELVFRHGVRVADEETQAAAHRSTPEP
jgi:uncharacterized membrane protein